MADEEDWGELGDLDDELDFDDEFDAGDPGADNPENRSPATQVIEAGKIGLASAGVGAGAGLAQAIKRTAPNTGAPIDTALSVAGDLKSMSDGFIKDIEPSIRALKAAGRKILPKVEGALPEGMANAAKKIVGDAENNFVGDDKATVENTQINSAIESIFGANAQLEEEKSKESRLNRVVDFKVGSDRHKDSMSAQRAIHETLIYQNKFIGTTLTAFLKKSIELKYRHLFLTKDMLAISSKHATENKALLEQIRHNTSLPDVVKKRKMEYLKETLQGKTYESISEHVRNVPKKLVANIKSEWVDVAKDKIDSFSSGINDVVDMVNDAEEMGADSSAMLKEMAIEGGAGAGAKALAMRAAAPLLLKYGDRIKTVNDRMRNFDVDAAKWLGEKSDELSMEGGIKGAIGAVLPTMERSTIENKLSDNPLEEVGYDIASRTSLVVKIPQLLSMIHQEVAGIRTGTEQEMMVFDAKTQKFTSSSSYTGRILKEGTSTLSANLGSSMARMDAIDNDASNASGIQDHTEDIKKIIANAGSNMGFNNWSDIYLLSLAESEEDFNSNLTDWIEEVLIGVDDKFGTVKALAKFMFDDDGGRIEKNYNIVNDAANDYFRYSSDIGKSLQREIIGWGQTEALKDVVDFSRGSGKLNMRNINEYVRMSTNAELTTTIKDPLGRASGDVQKFLASNQDDLDSTVKMVPPKTSSSIESAIGEGGTISGGAGVAGAVKSIDEFLQNERGESSKSAKTHVEEISKTVTETLEKSGITSFFQKQSERMDKLLSEENSAAATAKIEKVFGNLADKISTSNDDLKTTLTTQTDTLKTMQTERRDPTGEPLLDEVRDIHDTIKNNQIQVSGLLTSLLSVSPVAMTEKGRGLISRALRGAGTGMGKVAGGIFDLYGGMFSAAKIIMPSAARGAVAAGSALGGLALSGIGVAGQGLKAFGKLYGEGIHKGGQLLGRGISRLGSGGAGLVGGVKRGIGNGFSTAGSYLKYGAGKLTGIESPPPGYEWSFNADGTRELIKSAKSEIQSGVDKGKKKTKSLVGDALSGAGKLAKMGMGAYGSLLTTIGKGSLGLAKGVGGLFGNIFGSKDRIKKKDLETIVGEKLTKIDTNTYESAFNLTSIDEQLKAIKDSVAKKSIAGDLDGDGDRDGGWRDQLQASKNKMSNRVYPKLSPQAGMMGLAGGGITPAILNKLTSINKKKDEDEDSGGGILDDLLGGAGEEAGRGFLNKAKNLGKRGLKAAAKFGGKHAGKLMTMGTVAAETGLGASVAGAAAGVGSSIAAGATAIAGTAASGASAAAAALAGMGPVGWGILAVAAVGVAGYAAYKWLSDDSKDDLFFKERLKAYGVTPDKAEIMCKLEKRIFEALTGDGDPLDDTEEFAIEFMGKEAAASDDPKSMYSYFNAWLSLRVVPLVDILTKMFPDKGHSSLFGHKDKDLANLDKAYKKAIRRIIINTRKLVPTKEGFEKYGITDERNRKLNTSLNSGKTRSLIKEGRYGGGNRSRELHSKALGKDNKFEGASAAYYSGVAHRGLDKGYQYTDSKTDSILKEIDMSKLDSDSGSKLGNDDGSTLDSLLERGQMWTKSNEGLSLVKYIDSLGYSTIGYGHKNDEGYHRLTQSEADKLFSYDYNKHLKEASTLPEWGNANSAQKIALVDLVYNMGLGKWMGFKKARKAIVEGDRARIKREILDSDYARQVKGRAIEVADLLSSGDPKNIPNKPIAGLKNSQKSGLTTVASKPSIKGGSNLKTKTASTIADKSRGNTLSTSGKENLRVSQIDNRNSNIKPSDRSVDPHAKEALTERKKTNELLVKLNNTMENGMGEVKKSVDAGTEQAKNTKVKVEVKNEPHPNSSGTVTASASRVERQSPVDARRTFARPS
jgi:lysozyme